MCIVHIDAERISFVSIIIKLMLLHHPLAHIWKSVSWFVFSLHSVLLVTSLRCAQWVNCFTFALYANGKGSVSSRLPHEWRTDVKKFLFLEIWWREAKLNVIETFIVFIRTQRTQRTIRHDRKKRYEVKAMRDEWITEYGCLLQVR